MNLEKKWELLENEKLEGYKSIRITSKCKPNLFLGKNYLNNHCLILVVPSFYKLDFNTIKKDKISITLYPQTNYLVLELEDNSYYSIFDDLIISLYQVIKNSDDVKEYTRNFIDTFNKWSEFFEDISSSTLSKDSIRGLFGELFVLKEMIDSSSSSTINSILSSWKGPYDGSHDFVSDDRLLEIKTKYPSGQTVNISSEYQLESEEGKSLELLVLSITDNMIEGKSLRELFEMMKIEILRKSGDISIILNALKQKNISQNNILRYDNYRFKPIEETIYNAKLDSFPKLTFSNISNAISDIKYTLKLTQLNEFILSNREIK